MFETKKQTNRKEKTHFLYVFAQRRSAAAVQKALEKSNSKLGTKEDVNREKLRAVNIMKSYSTSTAKK